MAVGYHGQGYYFIVQILGIREYFRGIRNLGELKQILRRTDLRHRSNRTTGKHRLGIKRVDLIMKVPHSGFGPILVLSYC